MRPLAVVFSTLLIVSCSSGGGGALSQTTKAPAPGNTTASGGTPVATPTGEVDCTFLESEAATGSLLQIQILAQLRDQSAVDLIKSGNMAFDPDALGTLLTALAAVEPFAVPGLGDPATDLAVFVQANDIAKQIMANSGPVPQAQFDALITAEGDPGAFITRQISIVAALGEACP